MGELPHVCPRPCLGWRAISSGSQNGTAMTYVSPTSSVHSMAAQPSDAGMGGTPEADPQAAATFKIRAVRLSVEYQAVAALRLVTLSLPDRAITALIGPAGCGKSTFLRSLNRMNDMIPGVQIRGEVYIYGENVYSSSTDVSRLRTRVALVLERSVAFPMSVYDNVAYGPRMAGKHNRAALDELVQRALTKAALWEEVQGRLGQSAQVLSAGQQRRLCIARALATDPEVLLLDEASSPLDPVSTSRVEDLIFELKQTCTVVMATHNLQQAARLSDYTAFLSGGELVESGPTNELFTKPRFPRTEEYITGRFG